MNKSLEEQLIDTAENGPLETLKHLAKQGANIHAYNDLALRYAACNGHLEIVKYLVKQGANIHIWNGLPLRCAASNGHLEIVEYLKKQMEQDDKWIRI